MSNTLKLGNGKWATGKDTVLGYNSENNNIKPLPFSFSRDSSATVVNKDGLIETVGSGEPRIDFKDNTKGALLLEPSRTNKLTTSQDFSSFIKSGTVTTTTNYGISPSGQTDSTRVVFSSSNNAFYKLSGHSGNTETNSIYVKGTVGKTIKFGKGVTVNGGGIFTLNGEWQRLDFVSTVGNQFTINTYSSATARDIEIWGAQVEVGSYATSYIPTSGSAVTRVADACNQTPPDGVIGQTEGSIYSEFKCLDSITNLILWMRDPSGGNYEDMIKLEVNDSNVFRLEIREGNGNSANITSSVLTVGNYYKVAVAYKQNDYVVYINGVQIGTDSSGNVPTCSEMYIGRYIDGGIRMGVSKDLKLYNTRLSNSELAALTS